TYVSAGHTPPLLIRSDGGCRRLTEGGIALGMFEHSTYKTGQLTIQPDEVLAVYNDGVTQALNPPPHPLTHQRPPHPPPPTPRRPPRGDGLPPAPSTSTAPMRVSRTTLPSRCSGVSRSARHNRVRRVPRVRRVSRFGG